METETFAIYLFWGIIAFPVALVIALVIVDRNKPLHRDKGDKQQFEREHSSTVDPNPLLASPDLFDPHGIVASAEHHGDQYEIRQHSEVQSFARWCDMHEDRLGHIRKGQKDAGDLHEELAPTRRGGRNTGFVDRPSRHGGPLTKTMVRETVDSLRRGDRLGALDD